MNWEVTAPANIALIKYMGKVNAHNQAMNPSLSYTSDRFTTTVTLELTDKSSDFWQPLREDCHLSIQAQQRFLSHLQRLKNDASCTENFCVQSYNNFPAQCGLASSASAFAALTQCAMQAFAAIQSNFSTPSLKEQAKLSQQGSGSSCRSFLKPWVIWDANGIHSFECPYPKLEHRVIVVDQNVKAVSSSDAHQQVFSSLLYQGRPQRAAKRLQQCILALSKQQWELAYRTVWQEFWDMHALFATAEFPFAYIKDTTLQVLSTVQRCWQQQKDGPLVTLDAGPNVHLLFRLDQASLQTHLLANLAENFCIL